MKNKPQEGAEAGVDLLAPRPTGAGAGPSCSASALVPLATEPSLTCPTSPPVEEGAEDGGAGAAEGGEEEATDGEEEEEEVTGTCTGRAA